MTPPGHISVEIIQRRGVGRPIPHDIVVAMTDAYVAVACRHAIGHRQFRVGHAKRIAGEQESAICGRNVDFRDERAPCDVARVLRLYLRQHLCSRRRS